MEDNKFRLTGWASWGITIYAGTAFVASAVYFLYVLATDSPYLNVAAVIVGVAVLLTAAAALSAAQICITIDDVGIQRVDGAGRTLLLPWESITRLERKGTSQWDEKHILRSAHGTIVFDRTWERWEELKQEIQRRAYKAERVW